MNLRYRDERRVRAQREVEDGGRAAGGVAARLAAFAALADGRYAWAKLSRAASVGRWADEPTHTARHRAWRLIQVAELAHGAASLANFIRVPAWRPGSSLAVGRQQRRQRLVYAPTPRASSPSSTSTDSSCGRSSPSWRSSCCPSCPRTRASGLVKPCEKAARRRRAAAPRRAPTPDGSAASEVTRFAGSAVRGVRAVARDAPFVLEPCGRLVCYYCAAARGAQGDGAVPAQRSARRGARDAARQARARVSRDASSR